MGLVVPRRTSTGHRMYGLADRYRVAAIVQAKAAGMSLDSIRAMLTAATPAERNRVLQHQYDALSQRGVEAQAALALIDTALGCEHGDLASCPRFRAVLAERVRHP